ncbi:hypothetical protein [Bacillus sp. AFS096315]|uniref:hypothetical protein n=1 Tax=Bacillus sp. AFS096315 TaxID=2033517 RepID=UPI000BED7B1F|nr:hypothetical protein [Bacillus sp. AFS096315]PEC50297.1 hypothetical protein CON00_07035 [Bacillus sp. AFS096315]
MYLDYLYNLVHQKGFEMFFYDSFLRIGNINALDPIKELNLIIYTNFLSLGSRTDYKLFEYILETDYNVSNDSILKNIQ